MITPRKLFITKMELHRSLQVVTLRLQTSRGPRALFLKASSLETIWGVVKILVPFWVRIIWHLVFRGPKGDHNFDNHPYGTIPLGLADVSGGTYKQLDHGSRMTFAGFPRFFGSGVGLGDGRVPSVWLLRQGLQTISTMVLRPSSIILRTNIMI